jgi:superfamily II DNA or RNA helicase
VEKNIKKLVVSNKLYFSCNETPKLAAIEKALTYQIESMGMSKQPRFVRRIGKVAGDTWWAPIGNIEYIKEVLAADEYQIIDKRALVSAVIPEPTFELRGDQQSIYEEFTDSCIINGKPGFGKTITALAIAYKLQQKTLIVCTTTTIRDQWVAEIKKWFGFTPGVIGSGKFNIDSPLVVSNIQTVRKHGVELSSKFGILIIDEAHHCCAATFSQIIDESRARYTIGLTGTLKRKDGLEATFKGYFGEKIFIPAVSNTIKPKIHGFTTRIPIPGNMTVPWAHRINELLENQKYRELILNLVRTYIDIGHKVLVVSDRVEFLKWLHENVEGSHVIMGQGDSSKLENRDRIMGQVAKGPPTALFASISIFSEGVSLNELSCLINTTSTNNESLVEQLAGRIMRITSDKLDPVIVDIGLVGQTGIRHRSMRYACYAKNDWDIVPMTDDSMHLLLNGK